MSAALENAADPPLPAGWRWATLGDICEKTQYGWTTSAAERGNLKFLRTTDISSGRVDWSTVPYCEQEPSDVARFLVADGDIVVSRAGSVGKSFLIRDPERSVFASYLVRLRPKIDPLYVAFFMQSSAYWRQISDASSGIAIPNVNASKLAQVRIPVAPDPLIPRIVARIEELFGEIEAGEQELGAAKIDLGRYRRAVLKAAVTGELTREWREHNPPNETGADLLARILKERRARWEDAERAKFSAKGQTPKNGAWKARYPEPVAPNTADLPELPDGWAWSSLDQLTFKMTSGSRAWSPYYDRGSSIFIMAQNVRPARFDLSFKQFVDPPENDPERERTRVAKDDVLVTIVGANTGDVCRLTEQLDDAYVCQSVALLRPVDSDWSGYIEAFLVADEGGQAQFAKQIYGAGRPHLSFDQLRSVVVPIPPSGERAEVTALVREAIDLVAEFASQIDAQAKDVVRLRQSILGAAFSGKLVTETTPTASKSKRRHVA
ncbi:MAG: restriction endonuclease subunit S [Hyphomonadaceae bacterium]|nr:restriction endonuclease subunit S [Hyphomonadaceae bacterium]